MDMGFENAFIVAANPKRYALTVYLMIKRGVLGSEEEQPTAVFVLSGSVMRIISLSPWQNPDVLDPRIIELWEEEPQKVSFRDKVVSITLLFRILSQWLYTSFFTTAI